MSDNFYKAFEDRYRGSREVITERLRAYLPFIEPLAALRQPARALDVGCGRGEWLELAASVGFDAHGVDLDDGMLAACRERGLSVETADAIATLRAMADNSLAMVSAFHVVEHIPFDLVRTLIDEALRVLQPGGLLIMETPNPENLVVGASSFYRDPSHVRPLPPELLAFAAEHGGFARNKVVRLQEPAEVHADIQFHMHHVLEGVSPDYAVVAQKAAAPDVLERFDAAFGADYGMTLGLAAHRYDTQAAQQRGRLDTATAYAEQALDQLDAVRSSVSQLADNAAHAHDNLNVRLRQMEVRLAESEARVTQILSSYSWAITAPLRWMESTARRVVRAQRNGTLAPAIKRRGRAGVRKAVQAVLRRPARQTRRTGSAGALPFTAGTPARPDVSRRGLRPAAAGSATRGRPVAARAAHLRSLKQSQENKES